jgi:hypothetical protein
MEANEHNNIQINIRAIFNKNNCFDIFKNTKLDGEHIYEPMLNRQRLSLKLQKAVLSRHYQKIALIIRLKAVDRILLIRARLKLIELATNIFMLDVQQGQESFIPKELCQDSLPKCYKFYDPILLII